MKFPEVQHLMLAGEWGRAMGILERISRRYPEDADARKLLEICRTMLEIQSACRPGGDNCSDLRTVLKVQFREFLRGSSGLIARGLSGLPEPWRERLGYGKWLQWQETFSRAEEDLSFDHLYYDLLWRKVVLSVICGLIALGAASIVWIAWPASDNADFSNLNLSGIRRQARNGDPKSQYQLGVLYYRGTNALPQDIEKCYYWLSLAARSGYGDAARFLAKVVFEKESKRKILE